MKELSFNHGRVSFSLDTLEMAPCLPDIIESRIRLFYIDEDGLMETGFSDFAGLVDMKSKSCLWLHLSGSFNDDFWRKLKESFDLADEQIKYLRSPHRRSFCDDYANGIFWTMPRPVISEDFEAIETINFFLGQKILITRQFSQDNAFSLIIHYLMGKEKMLAAYGADRLAAELIEDIINCYTEVLKIGGMKLESIQNKIIRRPGKEELLLINRGQQIIWIFLNTVWPIESVILSLSRSKNPVVTAEGKQELSYRREEAASIVRLFETYRSMSYNLMDVYVSGLSLRTNETTTVLTIIATLFLPPTLIAGIYGMNFTIPEVHFVGGYYLCLGFMIAVSGSLLFWFKKKGFIDI
ncbi:MAG: hypothetical protein K2W82_10120 [Candidatus Obscuribacterales bacterium]|nr:hypothetical protein [Candidatus Obscuribacterales bacterium]